MYINTLYSSEFMYFKKRFTLLPDVSYGLFLLQVTSKYSQLATVLTKKKLKELSATHITLAHKLSHGVPALAAYAPLRGTETQVQLTAVLYSERLIALEVHLIQNGERPVESKNEWPHITVCIRTHFHLHLDMARWYITSTNLVIIHFPSFSTVRAVLKALGKFKGLQHEDKSSSATAWKFWEGQVNCPFTP